MPTNALSLVGFLQRDQALSHLRSACIPRDPSDNALVAEWQQARGNLGAPIAGAGSPDIQPLSSDGQAHFANAVAQPWIQSGPWAMMLQQATAKLVEVDSLLAFQLTIDEVRSEHHGGPDPLDEAKLLEMCLPSVQVHEQLNAWHAPGSMLLTSPSLNVAMFGHGMFNQSLLGVVFGVKLPFVHVVRFNGRCYLHNGFHRALAARRRGFTHVPCIFRDVTRPEDVGPIGPGQPIELPLLESADPPTLGHFTQGRAHGVQLRRLQRSIHVSWAEYATPLE